MKKRTMLLAFLFCCSGLSACSENEKTEVQTEKAKEEVKVKETDNLKQKEEEEEQVEKKITLTVNNSTYDITLYDTPAANALYEMLPLDVTFEDFNGIEKIAYLDETLPTENEPDGFEPKTGDFCLYAPWGNLSIFYKDFRYSESLISLGHVESGMEEIASFQNDFEVHLDIKK